MLIRQVIRYVQLAKHTSLNHPAWLLSNTDTPRVSHIMRVASISEVGRKDEPLTQLCHNTVKMNIMIINLYEIPSLDCD